MTTFLAAAIVLGLGILGMCVFLLKKDGEFPKYDVGSNPEMQKRGIRCFKDVDAELHDRPVKCDGNYSEVFCVPREFMVCSRSALSAPAMAW